MLVSDKKFVFCLFSFCFDALFLISTIFCFILHKTQQASYNCLNGVNEYWIRPTINHSLYWYLGSSTGVIFTDVAVLGGGGVYHCGWPSTRRSGVALLMLLYSILLCLEEGAKLAQVQVGEGRERGFLYPFPPFFTPSSPFPLDYLLC